MKLLYTLLICLSTTIYLISSCREVNQEESNTKCDSTSVYYDSINEERRFHCFINGLESYKVINSKSDTILHYKEISKSLIEKVYLENGNVTEFVNIVRFGEKENVNLNFTNSEIDSLRGSYFKFKRKNDSIYFKFSGYEINGKKVDSIWVSTPVSYFPNVKELFSISYAFKTNNLNEWIYLPDDILKERKLVVVGFSNYIEKQGTGGVMYGPFYLDSAIFIWNNRVLTQMDIKY